MRAVDLIGCGALNLDLIYRLPRTFALWDELGPPGSEAQVDDAVRATLDEALAHVAPTRAGGGQAANTAYALARLGYRAAMVGRVGADDDGHFLLDELAPAEGRLVKRAGETGRVYVLLDEDGERRNLVWPAANDAVLAGRPPAAPAAHPLRLLHVVRRRRRRSRRSSRCSSGCRPRSRSASTRARSTRATASSASSRSSSAARTCSPPRASSRCSAASALPEALDFLLNVGVGLVVCKMGGRGARLVGRRVDLYVPPQPAEVVDVTGAGDLFAAGFIAGLLEQVGLEAAGRLAAWAASQRHRRRRPQRLPGRRRVAARLAEERAARRREDRLALDRTRPGGLQPARRHRRARPAGRRRARHRRRVLRPRARRDARERPLPRPRRPPRLRGRDALERRELGGGPGRRHPCAAPGATTSTAASWSCSSLTASTCSCWPGTCSSSARPCAAVTRSSTCIRPCPAARPAPGRRSSGSSSQTMPPRPAR